VIGEEIHAGNHWERERMERRRGRGVGQLRGGVRRFPPPKRGMKKEEGGAVKGEKN